MSREQAEVELEPWFKGYLQADTEREGWPLVTDQQLSEFLASDLLLLPGSQGESLIRGDVQQPVLILLAATCLVLLLACLNVANLSLGRVLARARTTSLHAALGATRKRLLAEQFVESALLAFAGCGLGVLLAPPVMRAILSLMPQPGQGGLALSASVDWRVLLFAVGAAVIATMLSGLAPALYAASTKPIDALKRQSAGVAGSIGLRKALVVGQFALALVLLIGASLFTQTLSTLRDRGPGFATGNLMTFRVEPRASGYDSEVAKALIRRILASVQALPEVEQAAATDVDMLSNGWDNQFTIESSRRFVTAEDQSISMKFISSELFDMLGVPIVAGRNFDTRDARDDSRWVLRAAIINAEFERRYFANESPVGALVGIGNAPDTVANAEIVGVVATFQDQNLRAAEPQIFYPLWQRGVDAASFEVRTRASSEASARSIRAAVRDIDPTLAVLSLRTVDDHVDRILSSERMLASLAAAFAVIATLLAMIGLYAVLSFSAARRTKEIGIRLALGAPRHTAGGLIIREAGVLALVGLAIALPICWALGRLIESQLFGVAATDPLTIAGAAAILVAISVAASALPARAASSINPLDALRAD